MQRKGHYMIKEENRQSKKVEQVVALVPPWTSLTFFGGGGRIQRGKRGKNGVHQLSITLEDLYNGETRKLALHKNVVCDKCEC